MSEDGVYESDSTAGRTERIIACLDRTLAAPSARIRFIRETDFAAAGIRSRRRQGGLLRPAGKLVKRAAKTGWNLSTHGFSFTNMTAEGLIEPAASRFAVDFGSYAELYIDGQLFSGASGRALDTLQARPERWKRVDPWWMLAALRGTVEAEPDGIETVSGAQCERYAIHVDLARASAASPRGLYSPAAERFEDLLALPLTVWLDGDRIHRVRHRESPGITLTLELWDFGVRTVELDWTRLPTFKSPKRAAEPAG